MHKTFSSIHILIILMACTVFPLKATVYINEVCASNGSATLDPDFCNFSDWIELHNDGTQPVDLSNHYLSDNIAAPSKWQIPAETRIQPDGYLLVWADGHDSGYHANFKLSSNGETLLLSNANATLIDSITIPEQPANHSFGRSSDSSTQWYSYDSPTPGMPNTTKGLQYNSTTTSAPVFSQPGGFYTEPFMLTLTTGFSEDTLRYTTDGSEPDSNSPVYDTALSMFEPCVIRAKAFSATRFNSRTVTHTYIVNVTHTLPVISLSLNPEYLWDDTLGIYNIGVNGAVGFLGDTANYYQDWDRPANVEYFSANGHTGFNEMAEIKVVGLVSRSANMKGLSVSFDGRYGPSEVSCHLFPSRSTYRLQEFVLRNSGASDLMNTHMRDGFMNALVANRMDIDYQAYQPAVVYINGLYWGIHNIREKLNESYPDVNYNVAPDNCDMLETFQEMLLVHGDMEHYNSLVQFVEKNNLRTKAAWREVQSRIDIPEFINYHIAQVYFCNIDWPGNNVKMWRPKTRDGKWRWILSDVESGFNLVPQSAVEVDALSRLLANDTTDFWAKPWSTLLFRSLMDNPDCRADFIQTFMYHLSNTFDSTNVLRVIDSIRNNLLPDMPDHIVRWQHIKSIDVWNENIDVMKSFAALRPPHCIQQLKSNFTLDDASYVTFINPDPARGALDFNGQLMQSDTTVLLLFNDVPFSLKAVPAPGYHFTGWQGAVTTASDSVRCSIRGVATITAGFDSKNYTILPPVLTKDTHLTTNQRHVYCRGDITIDSGVCLTIDPGVTIHMADSASIFIYGSLKSNGTANQPVLFTPDSMSGARHCGALCFITTGDTCRLRYTRFEHATRSRNKNDDFLASITAVRSVLELANVTVHSTGQPLYAENGTTEIVNSSFTSPVTCDLIHIRGGSATVDGCDLRGNDAADTDGIDFDGVSEGSIRNNHIHDFRGDNSDGIDLGETSRDIAITGNHIYRCSDKGISVGQASTATLQKNIIQFCRLGIGIKDSESSASLDRNTFYRNRIAVACFEKNPGAGGGRAEVKNCILSESTTAPTLCDNQSELVISYSLATSAPLAGEHTLQEDPLFQSPRTGDFSLQAHSPCIDAGDPESSKDTDASRADIGACDFTRQIVINEINCLSSEKNVAGSWIELVNTSDDTIDLSGWSLCSGTNSWKTVITESYPLPPNAFTVLSGNHTAFRTIHKSAPLLSVSNQFSLDTLGETLILKDTFSRSIDSVPYTTGTPWPCISGTQTLALTRIRTDNTSFSHWKGSVSYGTPGLPNRFQSPLDKVVINEINYNAHPEFNADEWIELFNRGNETIDISGWILSDKSDSHQYMFPVHTTIKPGEYLIACKNRKRFNEYYPDINNIAGEFEFGFGDDGDKVRIFDAEWHLIDSVVYSGSAPWPLKPNGRGATLELLNPALENSEPEVWQASENHGTPGKINSRYITVKNTSLPRTPRQLQTRLLQNYPNPFRYQTTISFSLSEKESGPVNLSLYNIKGQLVRTLISSPLKTGHHSCRLSAHTLAGGTYFYRLSTRRFVQTKKFFLCR